MNHPAARPRDDSIKRAAKSPFHLYNFIFLRNQEVPESLGKCDGMEEGRETQTRRGRCDLRWIFPAYSSWGGNSAALSR
ncbi:MAG: hypothetical protein A3F83_02270 [Candidatus Glassbacteria bacterium RIFCSPLOWO2_12_FULL_58_11]|uniref:Uncharacterized protein n=1 Tax=Candidatus Glassbacteria bacterium RIFCSPLOWO2_12_FULL_58_11 TaxID=1817867 RepID=A0A1F5YLC1_9BACT|nr:MAG: hypothetical protein A3F83_02270 [Candidatus Glassbacteria bacterium RIFCSPLOWO2_12_FULL_58_11]